MDVTTYEKTLEKEIPAFKTVSMGVSDVGVDAVAKTGAATSVYMNQLVDGREFRLEFSWHLQFTEGGDKITTCTVLLHACGCSKLMALVAVGSS